jgi:primosomal protein N' (replication factor Y) (superfamily II helicase)
VVNMRDEFKAGNRSIFSRMLRSRMTSALDQREQIILFINRRGLATFVECMNCGFVPNCSKCSVALTYHAAGNRMICHHCRRIYPVIKTCPKCSSKDLKYFGIGTETVEAECRKLFPSAKLIRFDSDSVSKTKEYEAVVNSFRKHEADILIGTQIVAKGLNFPKVSLVGAVNADISLNLPDFRAGERTFQLLCQVAGRAGRGTFAGRAVIQTYNPDYYAIKFAAMQDYAGFYDSEIKYRRSYGYPPFNGMVRLVYSHSNEEKCQKEAERVAGMLKADIEAKGLSGTRLIGPTSSYISRLRGKYQMQVIMLGKDLQTILNNMHFPKGWILDVDPVGMI